MKRRQPKDVSASARQRLLNLARETGQPFDLLLLRYGIERFLYRLSQSKHADSFVLKGAMLFHMLAQAPHRPTRDIDLMSSGICDLSRMENILRQVVGEKVADDGVTFDESSVHAERIKKDQEYEGVRVRIEGRLGAARIHLQVDIGFGDAVTPTPHKITLPCLLDFAPPVLSVYPWEAVVSEKYQAMVALGMTNSRMKDFFDLQYIAREFAFDGSILSEAIRATFARRRTQIPTSRPIALTVKFTEDAAVRTRWLAFLRRSRLQATETSLTRVAEDIWSFLKPVTEALLSKATFDKKWAPQGPWR